MCLGIKNMETKNICQKRIIFISDLHFDFIKDSKQESGHRFVPENSNQIKSVFIDYVKENYANDILCLCGDFYNDTYMTLEFVKEMERSSILGFFVLGNHDYWNGGQLPMKTLLICLIKKLLLIIAFDF